MNGFEVHLRSYRPGEVILNYMEPVAKCLLMNYREHRCNNCLVEKNDLCVCMLCGYFRYCDERCQMEDWENGHMNECEFLNLGEFQDVCTNNQWPEYTLLLLRLYAKHKLDPNMSNRPITSINGTPQCFKDLTSHHGCQERRQRMLIRSEWLVNRLKALDPASDIEVDMLLWWFGIIFANSYGIMSDNGSSIIGVGIYAGPSSFQHSCKPTALVVNVGRRIQVRAIADIPEGTAPRISYLQNKIVFGDFVGYLNRTERRNKLLVNFSFDCTCELCESGEDATVDFQRLNILTENLLHFRPLGEHLHMHWEIWQMLRQIYHEFDEPITRQFHLAIHTAMRMNVDRNLIRRLLWQTLNRFVITFGRYHPLHVNLAISTLANFVATL